MSVKYESCTNRGQRESSHKNHMSTVFCAARTKKNIAPQQKEAYK